jgi:hypothetical protein
MTASGRRPLLEVLTPASAVGTVATTIFAFRSFWKASSADSALVVLGLACSPFVVGGLVALNGTEPNIHFNLDYRVRRFVGGPRRPGWGLTFKFGCLIFASVLSSLGGHSRKSARTLPTNCRPRRIRGFGETSTELAEEPTFGELRDNSRFARHSGAILWLRCGGHGWNRSG